MDDSSFIWIHWLKCYAAAGFNHVACQSFCQRLQSFFAFFTEVAAVDGNTHIVAIDSIDCKACKILDCIDSFAAASNNKAQIIAFEGNVEVVAILACLCSEVLHTHCLEDRGYILNSNCLFILFFYKYPNLCRIGFQSEQCFFRQINNFEFYLFSGNIHLLTCFFDCQFNCFSCCNDFFQTDTSSDNQ